MDEILYTKIHADIGDQILLYSDGVTEAVSPEGSYFSDDRLERILQDTNKSTFDRIQNELDEFCQNATQADDISVVVIQCDEH